MKTIFNEKEKEDVLFKIMTILNEYSIASQECVINECRDIVSDLKDNQQLKDKIVNLYSNKDVLEYIKKKLTEEPE